MAARRPLVHSLVTVGPSILIVEDDEGIRETLRFALELEGCVVKTAANGLEGLELLRSGHTPRLILLDLMMPIVDGWKFAEAVGRDELLAAIPIVVVTAFGNRPLPDRARGVLRKPIQLEELVQTAKEYCG